MTQTVAALGLLALLSLLTLVAFGPVIFLLTLPVLAVLTVKLYYL